MAHMVNNHSSVDWRYSSVHIDELWRENAMRIVEESDGMG